MTLSLINNRVKMTDNGGMVFGIKSFLSVDSYKGWFGGLT